MAAMVWDSCGRGLVQRHALMSTLTVLLAVNADTDSTLQRCAVNKDCTETPGEFCVPIGLVCHTTPKGAAPISGGISMQWCQPGTYAPLPRNNPECLACPGGKYQEKAEQTECDCIPAGQRAVDSVILEPCPIGTYYPGDCNESAGCLECDPGRFAPSTGAAKCECSKPGYGSTETGDAEEECPADQYSEECDACKECPAGSTSEPGSTVCEVIDTTGTTSTATGRLRSTTATTTGVSQKIPAETTSETSTSATGVSQKIPAETTSETSTSATGDWGDIAIVIADSAVQAGGGGGGGGAPTPAPSCGCAEDRGGHGRLMDVVWMVVDVVGMVTVVILGCLGLFGLFGLCCRERPDPRELYVHVLPEDTVEFQIVIDRTVGQTLGVDVDTADGVTLEIDAVTGGLFKQWNDNHPEQAVNPRDRIVEVNGIRNDVGQLVEECRQHKILEMVVTRQVKLEMKMEVEDGPSSSPCSACSSDYPDDSSRCLGLFDLASWGRLRRRNGYVRVSSEDAKEIEKLKQELDRERKLRKDVSAELAALKKKIMEEKGQRELPPAVTEEIQRERDSLIQSLSVAEDQLKVGGNEDKLKFIQAWKQQNDASLALLPFKAAEIANEKGFAFQFCLHDAMTLLKSKTWLGHQLQLNCQGTGNTGEEEDKPKCCLWAVADLDNFKVVNEAWSHAHGDLAIILACECVRDTVREWNDLPDQAENGFSADAMRFGGDEIVLTITMPHADQPPNQVRELLDKVHDGVCKKLQERFPFDKLKETLKWQGKKIECKGPAMSIGVSEVLPCNTSADQLYLLGFKRADDLLNVYKKKWKDDLLSEYKKWKGILGKPRGGGIVFADDLLKDVIREATEAVKEFNKELNKKDVTSKVQEVQEAAARTLKELAERGLQKRQKRSRGAADAASKKIAAVDGALHVLVVVLLDARTHVAQEDAAKALWALAVDASNQMKIADEPGALDGLAGLLSADAGAVPETLQGEVEFLSTLPGAKEQAARVLWALAVGCADNQKKIAAVPRALKGLVGLLGQGSPIPAQEQAASVLWALAVDDGNKKTIAAEDLGALKGLAGLLRRGPTSPQDRRQEQAAGALRILSADADNKKRIAAVPGVLQGLAGLLGQGSPSARAQEQAAGALRNLSADADNKKRIAAVPGVMQDLARLLGQGSPSAQAQEQAAGAFRNLTAPVSAEGPGRGSAGEPRGAAPGPLSL